MEGGENEWHEWESSGSHVGLYYYLPLIHSICCYFLKILLFLFCFVFYYCTVAKW